MFNFFRPKSIVSEASAQWLDACFSWAATHFDGQTFQHHTRLVQPTNDFFPGRVDSAEAMAATVFGHVQRYAGLQHWPLHLQPQSFGVIPMTPPYIEINTAQRGNTELALPANDHGEAALPVFYSPSQCQKPGDLAGYFASTLAQHLMFQARLAPPGGPDFFAMAAEVIAIFMGFGVLLANSAYSFRGSCAKCYNPAANRQAALTEAEVIHGLALFTVYKQLPLKEVGRHLKPYLRSQLKQAVRFIQHQKPSLDGNYTITAIAGD